MQPRWRLREGIVLLKNEGGVLPLDRSKIQKIVGLGPGADAYVAGGGSSWTKPNRRVTILAGLSAIAGNAQVTLIPFPDYSDRQISRLAKASVFEPLDDGKAGLTATFFNNPNLTGDPALREDAAVDFNWRQKLPVPQITSHAFSARWTGTIRPSASGDYLFMTRSDDGWRAAGWETEPGQLARSGGPQRDDDHSARGWACLSADRRILQRGRRREHAVCVLSEAAAADGQQSARYRAPMPPLFACTLTRAKGLIGHTIFRLVKIS